MTKSETAWENWTPAAKAKALRLLQENEEEKWRPFYCGDRSCDGLPHGPYEWNHARGDQYPPTDKDWFAWAVISGRGAGKTRMGAEMVQQMSQVTGRIALVGGTGADVRDTMLEGESGILSISKPGNRPKYEPSKRRLTWNNGCVATTFSGEQPDRLRGPEHGFAWFDEPAHWPLVQDAWDNALFGLRIGTQPRVLVTSTPKPRPWLRALLAHPRTRVTRQSTYANLHNLAPTFAEAVIERYEGTRLGRQELHGEMLEDVEGALWSTEMLEPLRVAESPPLVRIVVGVDPAGGSRSNNDETGIIVAGVDADKHIYVLHDASGHYTPHGWATRVDSLMEQFNADLIVAERNYGGEMVENTMRSAGIQHRIITVHAKRGKMLRAEPLFGYYEQGKVHHVGMWEELEIEMTTWQPYEKNSMSPNRIDALVYATSPLLMRQQKAIIASPISLPSNV